MKYYWIWIILTINYHGFNVQKYFVLRNVEWYVVYLGQAYIIIDWTIDNSCFFLKIEKWVMLCKFVSVGNYESLAIRLDKEKYVISNYVFNVFDKNTAILCKLMQLT